MGDTLNLFPQMAAIGRVDAAGNVYMTVEFSRALAALLVRVGGPSGMSTDDLALEALLASPSATPAPESEAPEQRAASVAELAKQVEALQLELATLRGALRGAELDALQMDLATIPNYVAAVSRLGTLAKQNANAVAITGGAVDNTPIGATTRSTGRFTTVGVGIAAPAYRFGVSNNGAAGLEFDSDGAAFGAGTTGVLAYDRTGGAYVPLHVAASAMTFRAGNVRQILLDATGVGFLGAAATAARQVVTGSRAGNAALASLLTAMATFGLITDSTTA